MSKQPDELLAEARSEVESLKRIVDTQKKKLETLVAELDEKTATLRSSQAAAEEKARIADAKIAHVDDLQAELAAVTVDRNRLEKALDRLSERMETTSPSDEQERAQSAMLGLQYELTSRRLQGNDEVLRQHVNILEGENSKLRGRILSLEAMGSSQHKGASSVGDGASQDWLPIVSGLREENAILQQENVELRRQCEDLLTKQLTQLAAVSTPVRTQPAPFSAPAPPCPKCAANQKIPTKLIRHCTTQTAPPAASDTGAVQSQEVMLRQEIEIINERHQNVIDQYDALLAAASQEKNELLSKVEALKGDLKIKALKIGKLSKDLESTNLHRMASPDRELLAAQRATAKAELEVRSLTRRIKQMELAREVTHSLSASQRGTSPVEAAALEDEFLPVHRHVTEREADLVAQRDKLKQRIAELQKEIQHGEAAVEYWANEMQNDTDVSSILMNARQRLRQSRNELEKTRTDLRGLDTLSESARRTHVSHERDVLMRY